MTLVLRSCAVLLIAGLLFVAVSVASWPALQAHAAPALDQPEGSGLAGSIAALRPTATSAPTPAPAPTPTRRPAPQPPIVPAPQRAPAGAPAPASAAAALPAPPISPISPGRVLALGDSVMLGAAGQLTAVLGDVEVDAKVSRQAKAGRQILEARHAAGTLAGVSDVVIHLGSNGTFGVKDFDAMMALLAGAHRVVFVNVAVPRKWAATNNAMLAAAVTRYPNAVLVDWQAAVAASPGMLAGDGIHLGGRGAKLYAALIAEALGR